MYKYYYGSSELTSFKEVSQKTVTERSFWRNFKYIYLW